MTNQTRPDEAKRSYDSSTDIGAPLSFLSFCKRNRAGVGILLIVVCILVLGHACSSMRQERSPFNAILPQQTPLVVEGNKEDVLNFLRKLGIVEPALADSRDLDGIPCTRLLYAAVPTTNGEDFSTCRRNLLNSANAVEDTWPEHQSYPTQLAVPLTPCPYGGHIVYTSDGNSFTLVCQGEDHRTVYSSTNGLQSSSSSSQPLIIVAFQSSSDYLQAAALPKHPDIKILASDPQKALQLLEDASETLTITYPRDTSLYASVDNAKRAHFWNDLPIKLPGKRSVITKDAKTGVYSLRADLAPSNEMAQIPYPDSSAILQSLPQGSTAWAGSTELLRKLELLPSQLTAMENALPQVIGVTTNASMTMRQVLPTLNSSLNGLTQAAFTFAYDDEKTAEAALSHMPWGDLSQANNPQCQVERQRDRITINIGDPIPPSQTPRIKLPKGPGPCQLGGRITLRRGTPTEHSYCFSAGITSNQFWLNAISDDSMPNSTADSTVAQPSPLP